MKQKTIPFQSTLDMPPVTLPKKKQKDIALSKSISILIGGAAGKGIKSLENILSDAFRQSGYFVFSTKEYMSRVRGGSNTTLLRISDVPIEAPCWQVDIFVALDADAIPHVSERLSNKTIIIADENITDAELQITHIPLLATANELGNPNYANSYASGILFGLLDLDHQVLSGSIERLFYDKHPQENKSAMLKGVEHSKNLETLQLPSLPAPPNVDVSSMHLIDGSSASGFGFLIGGCNMITSYPMSPSTGVLNFMASMSQEFEIVVEQSEDEIASLVMVIGSWFSGARAMTSTSGGGFALMSEAMSLSGVSETPAVIYLAQRPGPATGLPTRTEQGDLNLALHAGHGYFGRIILAPGDIQECVDYGYLAFELADRYQMPVIYLSDQYLSDSLSMIEDVDFSIYEQRRYIQTTDENYNRFTYTDTGISPRGVPGLGDGIVVSSSHEHDERGQSTEKYHIREEMVAKRKQKIDLVISEALAPTVIGEGSIAVITWGSSKCIVEEVLAELNDPRLFHAHFFWVYPLNPSHLEILQNTKANIVIENNVTGEFADILKSHDVSIDHRILQSNGFTFFIDQLKQRLHDTIKELP